MARFNNPMLQAIDLNGDVDTAATLRFEEPGTTTLKTIYSDSGLTTSTTNPQTTDSAGRFVGDVFLDGIYRVRLIDGAGATVFDFDPVGGVATGEWTAWDSDVSYNIPQIVLGSDDEYYRSLEDANQGNDPTSSPSKWELLNLGSIYNANITYGVGDTATDTNGYYYASNSASNLGNTPTTDTANADWEPAVRPENIDVSRLDQASMDPQTMDLTNFTASQSDQETGTSTDTFISPSTQLFNQSASKKWVNFNGSGTVAINSSFNVTSITDHGVGQYTANFTGSFSSATSYAFVFGAQDSGNIVNISGDGATPPAAASLRVDATVPGGSFLDPENVCIVTFGDV